MSLSAEDAAKAYAEADLLFDRNAVEAVMERMAGEIGAALKDTNPLVLCVMTGGVIFAGQLLTRLDFTLQVDYLHATRYRGATSGGTLHWLAKPSHPLKNRTVLVLDDIFDEGWTLKAILAHCRDEGAREVYSAVLVDKLHERKADLRPDFVGLEAPDRYLFGYGMDYKDYLRNAPGIFAVKGM